MTVEHAISKNQAVLMVRAQQEINVAQARLDLIAGTVLAGLEVEGRVVSVDAEKGLLTVEIPDIAPATDAA